MENGREHLNSVEFCIIALFFYNKNSFNRRIWVRGGGGGGGRGGWMPPLKVFLRFFPEDKTSTPDVFGSCLFILWAHFETSLVMVSCYAHEI